MEDLIDTRQLAARLHVKPDTIRGWVRRRWIPCLRAGQRGPMLFRLSSVEAALERRVRTEGSEDA